MPTELDRIQRIYCQALGLDGKARAAFLDAQCGSDAHLRGEVESLLAWTARSGKFLESSAHDRARRQEPRTEP